MLLKDLPVLSSLIKDYIDSGKSFFIPSLPTPNIIEGVSERFPNANFTVGHLVDLLIVINIILYFESTIYHYVKKTVFDEMILGYRDSASPLEYYGIYSLYKNTEKKISNERVLPYDFKDIFFTKKRGIYTLKEGYGCIYIYLYMREIGEKMKFNKSLCIKFQLLFFIVLENKFIFNISTASLLFFLSDLNINSFLLGKYFSVSNHILLRGKMALGLNTNKYQYLSNHLTN
jgi:hypothetical protein